jgi:hypothetical protein
MDAAFNVVPVQLRFMETILPLTDERLFMTAVSPMDHIYGRFKHLKAELNITFSSIL